MIHQSGYTNSRPSSLRIAAAISAASAIILLVLLLSIASTHSPPTLAVDDPGSLPLYFVSNRGQSNPDVHFEALSATGSLAFSPGGVRMQFNGQDLRLVFIDAQPDTLLTAGETMPGVYNDLRGSDSSRWIEGLSTHAGVTYKKLYPGIDLYYEGKHGRLKGTYAVAPGADPGAIRWAYTGAAATTVDRSTGDLVITLGDGSRLVEQKPVAWQVLNGQRVPVPAAFELSGGNVAFTLGRYDASLPLLIDPTFVYETTVDLGGFDAGIDIAVDEAGNSFVLGRVNDSNNDVLVAKFSPDGTLLFTTYLRGSSGDFGGGITLDSAGDVYLAGSTDSEDFPILNAAQSEKNGVTRDAFITKLSGSDGSLLFSTYFGGSRSDVIHDITLNEANEIYIVGYTESTDFPTRDAIQNGLNLNQCFCEDTFVTRLTPDAATVLYSTYLGGSFEDYGESIALDGAGNIFITGRTQSDDYPTQSAIQPQRAGTNQDEDVFVSKISADGSTLVYSTYLGGSDLDFVRRIAADSSGNAYLAGHTRSSDFPTTSGAYQEGYIGGVLDCGTSGFGGPVNCEDVFVTKIAPDGSSLAYSTYLGGGLGDYAYGIALNHAGEVFTIGYTQSTDFPGVTRTDPGSEITLAKLNASGSDLLYTVIIESSTSNAGHGIAAGSTGDVHITAAKPDLYVARISHSGSEPPPTPTPDPAGSTILPFNAGWNLVTLPLQPVEPHTASSLLSAINSGSAVCEQVYRWENGSWIGYVGGLPFNDFNIQMGTGYFVNCSQAGEWTMEGSQLQEGVPLDLSSGWNLVGIPYPSSGYTAQSLLDAINAQGGSCSEINRWENGSWTAHIDGLPFNNFDIQPTEGYFVKCSSPSLFTPGQ